MAWKKNSPEMIQLMDDAMRPFSAERRFMFGGPAYMINGNMFAGVCQDNPFLRLPDADRAELLTKWAEAGPFEPMPGKPMKEYVVLPPSLLADPSTLEHWIDRSRSYVVSLPAKEPASKKR